MDIEVNERDCFEVYDSRSINEASRKLRGKVIDVKEEETLRGRKYIKILLDTGYKIILK